MVKPWINLKYFLLFFIALWVVIAAVLYLITEAEKSHILTAAKDQQKNVIEKNLVTFEQAFVHAQSDIIYLAQLESIKDYKAVQNPEEIHKIDLSLSHFLATHLDYDHISFFDKNGNEVIGINQSKGVISHLSVSDSLFTDNALPSVQLQNLSQGQVYISEFDLNHQHDEHESPANSVIRLVTPAYNQENKKIGFIVAHLHGDQLFEKVEKTALARGMQTAFFRIGINDNFDRVDSLSGFSASMPSLISGIRQSSRRWDSLVFDGQLYSYYLFSPSHLSFISSNSENTANLFHQFPWLFIVGLSEKEIMSKLLVNEFNPWVLFGFINLFVLALSILFAYLRSSKASFERMLERQVSLFDGFFKNTPSAYLIKDLDGRIIYFNEVARKLFGEREDLSECTFADLGVVNAKSFSEIESAVVETGKAKAFETKIKNTQLHVTIFPIVNAKNKIIMIGSIAADQSKSLKRSEQSLRKYSQLLEMISNTQNLFMHSDLRVTSFESLLTSVISATNSERGLIGELYTQDDGEERLNIHAASNMDWNLANPVIESVDTDNSERFMTIKSLFDEVLLHKKPVVINEVDAKFESDLSSKEDHPLTSFLGLPVFYNDTFIGVIGVANSKEKYGYAVIDFISPLLELYGQMIHIKQVQQEKQAISKKLENKEHWLSMVINTAPDGILLVNKEGVIVLANQSVNELFGYEGEGLISKEIGVLVPESFRFNHLQNQRNYIKGLTTEKIMSERMIAGVSKSGETIPVEVRLSPAITEGSEVYIVCTVRDIRARLETEKQLRQSQKMDAIGQLTGGVAHDFNNLLGIIQGNLDLARMSIEEGANDTALLDISKAQEASDRSAKLIQRLLAFARKQPLTPTLINIEKTIYEACSLLEHALGSDIKLHTQFEPDTSMVKIDQQQFENALINLAVNAKDAMEGRGEFSIRVFNQVIEHKVNCIGGDEIQPGHYVVVEAEDSGCGLTEDQKMHIFEPFYTSKKVGKGTGLGLAMVYGFIRQSKGAIQVESQLEKGTVFKLYLPVSDEVKQVDSSFEADSDMAQKPARLLIVDDEKSLLESSAKLLEKAGYQVVMAGSAEQALELLGRQSFDLIFTDVVMQGELSGIDLILQVRQLYPSIKFVVGTGYSERLLDSTELQWLREFMILKPYREAELLKVIRHTLEKMHH